MTLWDFIRFITFLFTLDLLFSPTTILFDTGTDVFVKRDDWSISTLGLNCAIESVSLSDMVSSRRVPGALPPVWGGGPKPYSSTCMPTVDSESLMIGSIWVFYLDLLNLSLLKLALLSVLTRRCSSDCSSTPCLMGPIWRASFDIRKEGYMLIIDFFLFIWVSDGVFFPDTGSDFLWDPSLLGTGGTYWLGSSRKSMKLDD